MITRSYIKTTLLDTLMDEINSAIPDLLLGASVEGGSTTLMLNREPTAQEDIDLQDIVTNNVANDLVVEEQANTDIKMKEGFYLYKKIFSHITVNDPVSSIDGFISIYPVISTLRMLLKDAMFETSVRYMEKSVKPLNAFTHYGTYRIWVRDLAKKWNPAMSDAVLDALEQAPDGQI